MNEGEWWSCTNPDKLLRFLRGKASERKLRLFAVACCRRIEHLLPDERSRRVFDAGELYADGLVSRKELLQARIEGLEAQEVTAELEAQAREEARAPSWEVDDTAGARADRLLAEAEAIRAVIYLAEVKGVWRAVREVGRLVAWVTGMQTRPAARQAEDERRWQCELLRELFGNPFRVVSLVPSWLTSEVVALAGTIYEERRFQDLPVLADALEDAGCTDPLVLGHCRSVGPHARGCWVVDLLLAKD
jgi:hypothetical protein